MAPTLDPQCDRADRSHSIDESAANDSECRGLLDPETALPNLILPDELKEVSKGYTWRMWLCFFFLGTINNIPYVVVSSAAKSIVKNFQVGNLIGVVQWANVAAGGFSRGLNMSMEKIAFATRITITSSSMLVGLLLLGLSSKVNFSLAVVAIVLIGASSSFGESCVLSYLKRFSGSLTGAWASGTGMAGIFGALFFLAVHSWLELPDIMVFLMMTPLSFIYWICFKATQSEASAHHNRTLDGSLSPFCTGRSMSPQHDTLHRLREGSWSRTFRCFKLIQFNGSQLCLVYFLEYCISILFASVADRAPTSSWWSRNSYEILASCYQIGVLVSRSSIDVFKVRRVYIITLLQLCNFVVWFIHSYTPFISLPLQFILMTWVGLLGGAMYVNVFYLLTEPVGNEIAEEDRELCINLTALFITVGISSSALLEIISCATFMDCKSN